MEKILTPHELGELFVEGNFAAGDPFAAGLLVISKSNFVGWLSIFNVYLIRKMPRSVNSWLFWITLSLLLSALSGLLTNHGKLELPSVLAGFIPSILLIAQCIEEADSKYQHTIKTCQTCLKSTTQDDWTAEQIRRVVQTTGAKNLAEFTLAIQKHPNLCPAKKL